MQTLEITSVSADATMRLGEALGRLVQAADVVLLSGDLGAGKTQLTKGLARGLGITEPITSPTFNMLLVHEGRLPLYHFDLYRLERAAELEDLDYFGTLESDGISVVEWGDRFEEASPQTHLSVALTIEGDEARCLHVAAHGPRAEALLAGWANEVATVSGANVSGGGE